MVMKQRIQLPPVGKIKSYFPEHRQENVRKFLLLVQLVIMARTVCIYKLRSKVGLVTGKKKLNSDSVYTKLVRFFRIGNVDAFCVGVFRLILQLLGDYTGAYVAIDRTNWKIGTVNVNVLAIGLVLPNRVFIPFLWKNLEKKGNSSTAERKELLRRFLDAWGRGDAKGLMLLGDREFVGRHWFEHIAFLLFGFTIRLRKDEYWKELSEAMGIGMDKVGKKIRQGLSKKGFFTHRITIEGVECHYTAFETKDRKGKTELLVLLTTEPVPEKAAGHYRKRWGIEVFFGHVKTNGFNLEDINLKQSERVHLMVAVVAVAYVVAIWNGIEAEKVKPTKMKKYKTFTARAISLFRKGMDEFENIVHNIWDLSDFFLNKCRYLKMHQRWVTESVQ